MSRILHFVRPRPELQRLPDVAVEQVDVRGERERRGVVAEPPLHLYRVAALGEQHRRAGVAEGVESDPRQARLLARRA